MSAGSVRSETAVVEAVDAVTADGADASALGDDLFGVVAVLDSQPPLRRSLSEPAIPSEAKQQLVAMVFHGKISDAAEKVVARAVESRWSRPGALADALEHAGVVAHVIAAEQAGELDELEDELFRFARIADATPELRGALSDRRASIEAKRSLLASLVEGKVTTSTERLLAQAVSGRGRPFAQQVEEFQTLAASRRNRLLATVRVAIALPDDQLSRLEAALEAQYDHPVHLNVIIDPDIMGGVRVTIGHDVLDSTISQRLAEASRRLAG